MYSYYKHLMVGGVLRFLEVVYEYDDCSPGYRITDWVDPQGESPHIDPETIQKVLGEIIFFENSRPLYVMEQQSLAYEFNQIKLHV